MIVSHLSYNIYTLCGIHHLYHRFMMCSRLNVHPVYVKIMQILNTMTKIITARPAARSFRM